MVSSPALSRLFLFLLPALMLLAGCAGDPTATDSGRAMGTATGVAPAAPAGVPEGELLAMVPGAQGYELGSPLAAAEEERFAYRGRQAGHTVLHREIPSEGEQWRYTDLLLHIGPAGRINRIVLLRQFTSREEARRFYTREYEAQRERYRLAADSGTVGSILFSRIEAYPDRASWESARGEYVARGGAAPFAPYYHPLIARRSAIFVYVQGVPTVARIYESHHYPSEEAR